MVQGQRLGWLFACVSALALAGVACVAAAPEDESDDESEDQSDQTGGGGTSASGGAGGGGGEGDDPAPGAGGQGQGGVDTSTGGSGGSGGMGNPDAAVPTPDAASTPMMDARAADATMTSSALVNERIVWNGDGVGSGSGAQWMGRGQEGKTTLSYSTGESRSSTHAVAFKMSNINYGEFGWGIGSTPANQYKKFGFWVNMVRAAGKTSPGDAFVTFRVGGGYAAPGGGRGVRTITYNKTALQGGWQQIVIPVADIVGGSGGNITEILIGLAGCGSTACDFTLYLDDIAFGN